LDCEGARSAEGFLPQRRRDAEGFLDEDED